MKPELPGTRTPALSVAWRTIALTVACIGAAAHAQTANLHDGRWEATIAFPAKPIVADLTISGEGGSFRSHFGGNKNNACGSRDTPVVVRAATVEELRFTIEYSKVMNGCHDLTVDAKRVDDRTYKGRWPNRTSNDIEVTLVKK